MKLWVLILLLLAPLFSSAQSKVTFKVSGIPQDSLKEIGIRGSISPLDWGKSIPLQKRKNGFEVTLEFEDSTVPLEFKFVRFNDDATPSWESIQNRNLNIDGIETTSENIWNREQVIDPNSIPLLSPNELLEDFNLIKTMVLKVHPGTYRYNSKQEIDDALLELEKTFQSPMSHGAAYLAMSKLTAKIKCDHTKPGFNNQNGLINSVIHFQKDKVPFAFKWIEGQIIVTHDATVEQRLKRGTRILKINGIDVQKIQLEMAQYIGADGATDLNRIYKMEVDGYDFRYSAFDVFFPLLYPLEEDFLALQIQEYGKEEIEEIHVPTVTGEERFKMLVERYSDFPRSRDDLWKFEIIENRIGLLTLNSFGLFGWKAMTLDYKLFLKNAFQELQDKKIHSLIIDIRKNTGGVDEMANELYSYLSEKKFEFDREGRMRYLTFPESLRPFVQTWGDNPWYFDLDPDQMKEHNGYYSFKQMSPPNMLPSKGQRFKGKVFLMTSSANTSLAFYTAHRFKKQEIGVSIGQETGGNLNDINGGQILFLRLPNSQIEIDFPVMGGFAVTHQADMGVQPDIPTTLTIEDIVTERDVELETLLRMIK